MVKLYGKPLRVSKASQDRAAQDVGANLFIGNLDPDVDETVLYNTFSAFGVIVGNPKIQRDPDSGVSKGFGFIAFDDFDASDMAIEAMNGQYLGGRPISVAYAYKKDTKGERHGTPAERLLAAQKKANQPPSLRPHTMFASGPSQQPQAHGVDANAGIMMAMQQQQQQQQQMMMYNAAAAASAAAWGWGQAQQQYGYDAYGGMYASYGGGAVPPNMMPPPPPPPPDRDYGGEIPPPPS